MSRSVFPSSMPNYKRNRRRRATRPVKILRIKCTIRGQTSTLATKHWPTICRHCRDWKTTGIRVLLSLRSGGDLKSCNIMMIRPSYPRLY